MTQDDYIKIRKVVERKLHSFIGVNSTVDIDDIINDTYIKVIEKFGVYTVDEFVKTIKESINESIKDDKKSKPYLMVNSIDTLNKWIYENPEKVELARANYLKNNIDKVRQIKRDYCRKNKEVVKARAKKWNEDNQERYKELQNRFHAGLTKKFNNADKP